MKSGAETRRATMTSSKTAWARVPVPADGSLSFVNQAYCRFAGRSREDLIGRSFFSLIPRGLREKVMASVRSLTVDNPASQFLLEAFTPGELGLDAILAR